MNTTIHLKGAKSEVKTFTTEHLNDPQYLSWLKDYEVVKTIGRPEYLQSLTHKDLEEYYEDITQRDDAYFFAIYADNTFIGTAKIQSIKNGLAELGIMIGNRTFWGKGIAIDVLKQLSIYCFEKLQIRKVWAGMLSVNKAMIATYKVLGFKEEGVFRKTDEYEGEFVDHIYMGCFPEELRRDL